MQCRCAPAMQLQGLHKELMLVIRPALALLGDGVWLAYLHRGRETSERQQATVPISLCQPGLIVWSDAHLCLVAMQPHRHSQLPGFAACMGDIPAIMSWVMPVEVMLSGLWASPWGASCLLWQRSHCHSRQHSSRWPLPQSAYSPGHLQPCAVVPGHPWGLGGEHAKTVTCAGSHTSHEAAAVEWASAKACELGAGSA